MKRLGAQHINVFSGGGYLIVDDTVTYCATKFYVSAFTEGLAQELKEKGVAMQAKVLAPAATETEFIKHSLDSDEFSYEEVVPKFHTAKEMAGFMLELFDSERVVGIVDGEKSTINSYFIMKERINVDKFKKIQNNHLALTQYYRWYQVYEIPLNKARLENQLGILDDQIVISSQAGTTKGKLGLEERLKMFEGWKNAHHVENTTINQVNEDELSLEADILYQNIRPDDSRYSYRIHYSTALKLRENDLPLFTKVELEPIGVVENPGFISAYADNRAKSFMHYWLYLMETASVNGYKFKELLAEEFELNFSTGKVDTLEKFNEWLATTANQVKQSGHYPKNLSVTENTDNTIQVSIDFEWEGISVDNKPMIAETHHEWVLENNLDERFARMKRMEVTQIKPFQTVE